MIMSQFWANIAFVHWRVDEAVLAPFMPPGARPDVHDGSAWVGLLPFRMERASIGTGPAVPYLGTFWETNVRIYSTDDQGRPGVVFLSLEAQRLAVVLGARLAFNVPYFWAHVSGHSSSRNGHRYQARRRGLRRGRRPRSVIDIEVGDRIDVPGETELFLSARFGLHTSIGGRGVWVPNTHQPWPLHTATVTALRDELVAATGLPDMPAIKPPDHVMFSPGVHTQFGMPSLV
ncbi:YqjF family protein [soil metagenome]